jgi:uncharacterized damage-inducible protein DinB
METIIAKAQSHLESASKRVIHLLSFVPDDRLTWAPESTARSFLQVVAHIAATNRAISHILSGTMPETMPSPEEFFSSLRASEESITTKESAIASLQETAAELCNAIATVTPENIDSERPNPFGPMSAKAWLDVAYSHIERHIGQLDYLQTLWGDLDNHL